MYVLKYNILETKKVPKRQNEKNWLTNFGIFILGFSIGVVAATSLLLVKDTVKNVFL